MSNVVPFRPRSPLSPFLGQWHLDPLSISRNKIAKRILGSDNVKMLWDCDSMDELIQAIRTCAELRAKYEQLLTYDLGRSMLVAPQSITRHTVGNPSFPAETVVLPVLGVTTEGKNVVVKTKWHGRPCDYVLKMKSEWLMVTERMHLVPQLVHRYHRQKVECPESG